ncbi:MAG: zinc-binding dehydrogenase [Actinomycetota bacterium]
MKALYCYDKDDFRLEEMPTPEIGDGDILVEMIYTGLCGSDIIKIFDPANKKPRVYGHELVGRIAGKGKKVDGFEVGDIVVAAHHIPCYSCHYCLHGNHTMCRHFKETNIFPGSFAQYIRLSEEHVKNTVFKLPESQDLKEAIFIEPLGCCIRAMDRINYLEGDYFTVVGVGAIGLLFVQLVKLGGAKVVAIDLDSQRLGVAKELGADLTVNPAEEDLVKKVKEITGIGADQAILTVTNRVTLDNAVKYLRDGGEVNIFGMASKRKPFSIDFERVYKRELTIRSHYSSTPETLKKAYDLVVGGRMELKPLVSDTFDLKDFKAGLDMVLDKKIYKAIYKL